MQNAIEVKGLRKQLGNDEVLADLDLEIAPGALYGLLGRNGAGKTTLLKSLMGLLIPDQGTAKVLGRELAWDSAAAALLPGEPPRCMIGV